MKKVTMSPPTLGFIVATRAALAFGIGMLIAKRVPERRRKLIARTLVGLGVATTVPAAVALKRQNRRFIAA